MHLDMKIIQVHACTTLQIFVAAILFQNCPLDTCLIPRFMRVYEAKDGKTKYARVFMQKMQCSCKKANGIEGNSNMQWLKSNME